MNNTENTLQFEKLEEYKFKIGKFDGPLDLLLSLVKDKKINIMDVDIAEIATQYLQIIKHLQDSEINLAGDYLLMAATLIQLKAKMILEEPEEVAEVEEEKQNLIQQLIEYQQFKEIKEALKTFQDARQDIFIKKPSNIDEFVVDSNDARLDGKSNIVKLVSTLRKMFERVYAQKLRMTKLETFKITPADQFDFIMNLLKQKETLSFEEVFTLPSLNHFVVTLIAVLDLSRRQKLIIEQEEQFGEIVIKRGPEYEK
ncbi:aromatic-ring-hydroxylating dioxygenase [Mycoplasmopsis gallinacea]|uniref:Segregation and condensation protein A n=1 Tax=Mycoplasmopsis gallinacea TaxID=29556 RepID=A0A0D5ZK60_9BACT|nr:aromatic-ring-hydroxylating dioxygenase [Mycoplasmopsis gallinacea]